jgi:hypothetical protein
MALSTGFAPRRYGQAPTSGTFAYKVRAGVRIYEGAMAGLDSSGNLVPVNTAGAVAVSFAGMAMKTYDNSANGSASADKVEVVRGTYQITVPGAVAASVNAAVYATDDNTFTLTVGSNLQVGNVAGFDGAQTYVRLI